MKKSQAYIYGLIMLIVFGLVACNSYIEPDKQFLDAKVVTPIGMNNFPYGEISVSKFQELLSKRQMDNGKYPQILV